MGKKLQYKRLLLMTLLLVSAFAGLGYRLVDLQALQHAELSLEAQNNTRFAVRLQPRRGDILDDKGNLLATSVFVKTVIADPALLRDHEAEVAHAIAPLLDLKEGELVQKLTAKVRINDKGYVVTNHYVVLKHKVSSDVWEKIRETMDRLTFGVNEKHLHKKEQAFYRDPRQKGIGTEPLDDQLREYPGASLASHVVGFVGEVDRTNSEGVRIHETAGKAGMEYFLDAKLKGVGGWRLSERDGHHQEMVALREENVEPHDGLNVVLTIDSVIQHYAEEALAGAMQRHSPLAASALVIRPRTGEILAFAGLPDLDPNYPGTLKDPSGGRNRLIYDVMEPGSTFKSVVVAAALSDGIVKLTDQFDCEHSRFEFGGRILHDHESYGILTVQDIVAKSSNIGAAKIGILMGKQRLYQHLLDFGFGQPTGIELPWESKGVVHDVKDWKEVAIAQTPMGQGVGVTSIQMAMALGAIANNGVLMRPQLIRELREHDGSVVAQYSPEVVRRVISEGADREIIQALKAVVTDGTAKNAAMTNYTVAGKTGTAQVSDGHHYLDNKYYASFIGFLPADNPELLIYVSLDQPKGSLHQGGQAAAPVFREIAEKTANYLNIRPDKTLDVTPPEPIAAAAPGR